MKNKIYRISLVLVMLCIMALPAIPVYAISNPNSINFGYYNVFENVLEDGDMCFIAEGKVIYAITPTDYTADESFIFDVLDAAGTSTLLSRSLDDYGDRPLGIYVSAAQKVALGLASGSQYKFRISGNPTIFASQTGNTVTITLSSQNYIDQLLGVDNNIPTNNNMRNGLIVMAYDIQTYDSPADDYVMESSGNSYLTTYGADLFLTGIPGLADMCPILFQVGVVPMNGDAPNNTGSYASTLNIQQQWGTTAANGLTNLGVYLGISQSLAGSVMLFALAIMLAMFIYAKTQSGITVLLMIAATPAFGVYLGLMSMAIAFIFVIFIIVLLGYFFFSRGAL